MWSFILRRLIQAIPLLFIITIISFLIINLAPGDPVYMFVNPDQVSQQDLALIRLQLGLDKPLPLRYAIWLGNIMRGDLGNSFYYARPVSRVLMEALPNTLILALCATIFSFAIAIPAGIISAMRRNTAFDYAFSTVSFIGVSLPSFWFGLLMILVFSLRLDWLPTSGMYSLSVQGYDFWDRVRHLVLPTLVLGMGTMASKMRYMRSAMLEVIRQDYVRTAKAKGLASRVVIGKHALRNALLPVITLLGFIVPSLVGGAAIVETIFGWPGIGRIAVQAAFTRDYPLMMGNLLLSSTMVILGSLLADVLYAVADPRIRYD
ncbi:MAG: peptide/nickel transport system permease protein [Spirochaetes bacterium]|nr:MAG: peptide/nickel transport system permease protein [Spirochaetota bacterium]